MADIAHRLTDEKLEEMEKRLSAIYSGAETEIGERWKEYLVESQAEIYELQKAYEIAKKGGDAKEIRKAVKKLANAKRERTLMNSRFNDLTETTAVHKHPHLHGYLHCHAEPHGCCRKLCYPSGQSYPTLWM